MHNAAGAGAYLRCQYSASLCTAALPSVDSGVRDVASVLAVPGRAEPAGTVAGVAARGAVPAACGVGANCGAAGGVIMLRCRMADKRAPSATALSCFLMVCSCAYTRPPGVSVGSSAHAPVALTQVLLTKLVSCASPQAYSNMAMQPSAYAMVIVLKGCRLQCVESHLETSIKHLT